MRSDNERTPLLVSKRLSNGSFHFDKTDGSPSPDEEVTAHQRQKNENYLTDLQAMMHFLKASVGIGILSLPEALMNGGIVVGTILLVVIAIITIHCTHLLVECSRQLCTKTGRSTLNYGELANESVKLICPDHQNFASTLVNILLCSTQFGICTAYVLFIAENLHDGMAEYDAVHIKTKLYILIIMPFLILFCLIRDLGSLSWLSSLANIVMVVVLISIYQYLYRHLQEPSELHAFSSWGDLPLFFGSAVYAFEAVPVILPLENKIRHASHFPRIINIGMVMATLLYFNMAIFGYMTFKDECKGSITLNLPDTKYYSAVKFMVSVAIFFTYFIQIFVVFQIMEPVIQRRVSERYYKYSVVLMRVTTVCLSCGLAAAIPHLNDIVSLVGSSCSALLAFVCPTFFHWIIFSTETSRIGAAKNIFIIAFATVGCVTGTFASLRNIIQDK